MVGALRPHAGSDTYPAIAGGRGVVKESSRSTKHNRELVWASKRPEVQTGTGNTSRRVWGLFQTRPVLFELSVSDHRQTCIKDPIAHGSLHERCAVLLAGLQLVVFLIRERKQGGNRKSTHFRCFGATRPLTHLLNCSVRWGGEEN